MAHNPYIPKSHSTYDRTRELRAEMRNAKHDGSWRKSLRKLEKLNSIDLESLIHGMAAYLPKNPSKRDKILLIAAATLFATATIGAAYAYYTNHNQVDKYAPKISNLKYSPDISPGHMQSINFTATDADAHNITRPENIVKAVVEITSPSGHAVNRTASRVGGLESSLFSVDLNATQTAQEGQHKIRAIVEDKAGNAAVERGNFTVTDKPPKIDAAGISPAQAKKGGSFTLYVKGSDDVGVKEAYAKVSFPNASKIKVPLAFNGTHYTTKLPADRKGNYTVELYLIDTKNQTVIQGPYKVNVYTLVEEQVRNQVLNDRRIPSELKPAVLASTLKLLDDLNITELKNIESVWALGNCSRVRVEKPVYSDTDIMQLVRKVELNPDIAMKTPRLWSNMLRLSTSVGDIIEYPILLTGGAEQVDCLLYDRGLAGNNNKTQEELAWNKFAIPAIDYIVKLVNNGNFTVNGFSREEARRLLLPIELTEMDIKTGEQYESSLPLGIKNVTPDSDLNGTSPQEWLGKTVYRIYNEKGARYERAIFLGNRTWGGNYPLCEQSHKEKVKFLLENGDDISVFIYGNAGLDYYKNGPDGSVIVPPIVVVKEQHTPHYMVLVGRPMGRVVVPHSAKYLPPSKESHSESIVRTKNGDYMGLWADLDAYFSDCANASAQPTLERRTPDGHYIKVDSKSR